MDKKNNSHPQRTVVVVEDNDNIAKLISRTLSDSGFKTKTFSFGSAAVFFVLDNPKSLLLMEYYLPDMTAKEIVQSLHANKKEIPYAIISNPGNEKTIVEMMKMGARDCLVKEKGFIELLPSAVAKIFDQLMVEERLLTVEKSLRYSRDKFRHIFDSIADAIFIYDLEGNILEANEAAYLRWGRGDRDLSGINCFNFQSYLFRQHFQSFLSELRSSGQSRFETIETDGKGEEIPVECVTRMIVHDGRDAVLTISRDISEQKKVSDLLEQSEQRFQRITNSISDYIVTVTIDDGQAVKTTHSSSVEQITGYSSKELEERPFLWLEMVFEEDKEFVLENVNKIINGEQIKPFEHRIIRKDGTIAWLKNSPVLHFDSLNKLTSYDGVIQDITERKNIELKILEQQARLSATVQAFDGLVYICTADYKISFANDKLIERTGYDPTGQDCFRALHNREDICPWCVNPRVQKGETVRWEIQSPKDDKWYSVVNIPIYHQDGSISKQSLILDISDKKYADQELNKLNRLYFGLIDEITVPVCRFSREGSIINANKAFYEYFSKQSDKNRAEALTISDFLPQTLKSWTKEGLALITPENGVIRKRFKLNKKADDMVWTVKAIYTREDEVIEYQGIVTDFRMELDGEEKPLPVSIDA